MIKSEHGEIELASQLEQFETSVEAMAPVIQTYYQALIDNDVPHDLAVRLVESWHAILWTTILNFKRSAD